MRIGFCAKPDQAAKVAAAGFDFIEPPVNALAAMTREEFETAKRQLGEAGIPAPTFNLLFPKPMALLSDGVSDADIREYLTLALSRVRELGGKIAVFGSGKSRMRPEGMSYDAAFRCLVEITRLTGEIAAQHGVTVVIEPLNCNETNMINSLGEGACLVAAVNHPSVALLADYYHVTAENQKVEDIERLCGIAHAHIATAQGRRIPLAKDEGYTRMFAAMKKTGYDGLLSIEGKSDDLLADGPVSAALLKQLWEEA